MKRVGLLGPARFLFPEWYNLPLLLLQSFAKKYTINCKIIGKTVERRRRNVKGPVPFGWQPAAERQSPAHGRALWRDIIEVQRANTPNVIESKKEQGGVCNAQI